MPLRHLEADRVQINIESAVAVHFRQPSGPGLQCVSWLVRIEHGGQPCHARVQALLASNASRATRRDQHYQARTTMQYPAALIEGGWNPSEERERTIKIGDPPGDAPSASPRPWWKL